LYSSRSRLLWEPRTGGWIIKWIITRLPDPNGDWAARVELRAHRRRVADELRNVRLRETTPGVVRIDHDPDRHDDRAIALALAASKLLDRPPTSGEASIGWDPGTVD
jgi:hypothetical protein